MRRGIGIGIHHDYIRAVFVRRRAVVWMAEKTCDPGDSLAASIETLLAQAPLSRWRREPVNVAVGAFAAQVKLLVGLPATDDTRALAAVVREGAGSFFLRNRSDLVTTGVQRVGEGRVWAAAIELATADAIREACRNCGLKLRSIAPAATVLPLVARNDRFTWRDGPIALEICRSGPTLEAVRRVPAALVPADDPSLDPVEPLALLGPDAERYSTAYGATLIDPHTPLALGPDGLRSLSATIPARRLMVPSLVGGIGLIALLLSPLGTMRVAQQSQATLNEQRSTEAWHTMVTSMTQLQRITAVLEEVEAFAVSRPECTRMLAELARILPDQSAIVRIDIDGSEGNLSVMTPNSSAFVASLRSLPNLSSADVIGQVMRQNLGGREIERATIRFRIGDSPQRIQDRSISNDNP